MSNDQKIFKIDKLDFGVNMKKLAGKETLTKSVPGKKDFLKDFSHFIKFSYVKLSHFSKVLFNELNKRKKQFSRSIFLGRGFYFKYIANLALLLIILVGAFVYLSFDRNDPKGFLSKYSGITSANSGVFLNTGTQTFITEKQFKINQHTINPGDTLSTIAAQYSTQDNVLTIDSIMWANGLKSGDILKPGMVLDIPPVSGVIHTVKKDDSVISIARRYKLIEDKSTTEELTGVIQQIIDVNLLDVRVVQGTEGSETKVPEIVAGQRIIVPGGIIEAPKLPRPAQAPITLPRSNDRTTPIINTNGLFVWPVANGAGVITQRYSSYHTAIDIADRGAPVLVAMFPGTVTFAGRNGDLACGITVQITYDNGFSSIYCHMSSVDGSLADTLRNGVQPRVEAGQAVGRMGASGKAFGIHVHLALKYRGVHVNPCGYAPFKGKC